MASAKSPGKSMDLFTVVHAFRKSLEAQHVLGHLPAHLLNFPRGCCGVVSELLGDYLNTQLGLRVEYVFGEQDGASHAWVELDGVVIDITCGSARERYRSGMS